MSGVPTLAVVLVGGVIGYEYVGHKGAMPPADPATVRTTLQPGGIQSPTNKAGSSVLPVFRSASVAILAGQGGHVTQRNAVDQKLTDLKAKVESEYNKLSCDAKKDGAKRLKDKYPSISLDPDKACDMSYDDLAKTVGGAAGAAACNAIPGVGTLASPLCAIAGAYVADKIEQWVESNWHDAEDWVKSEASDAEDWAKRQVSNAWDTITSWF